MMMKFIFLLYVLNTSLTKGGRRMFPVLRVVVRGLDPETLYDFKLDFLSCDSYRWRYVNGQWQTNGKQDNISSNQERRFGVTIKGEPYSHPKSPNYGRFWMSDVVEFKNVKLTNRANPTKADHVKNILYIFLLVCKIQFPFKNRSFLILCININQEYTFYNHYQMDNQIYY